MACDTVLVPGATNVVAIGDPADPQSTTKGLHNLLTGLPVNDAMCTVERVEELYTRAAIAGWTMPAAMGYLASSRGVYTAETPVGLALADNAQVRVNFKAVKDGKVALFTKVFTVSA